MLSPSFCFPLFLTTCYTAKSFCTWNHRHPSSFLSSADLAASLLWVCRNVFPYRKKSCKPICIAKDFITSEAFQNAELFLPPLRPENLHLGRAGCSSHPRCWDWQVQLFRMLPARWTVKTFEAIFYFHSSVASHLYCGVRLCSYSWGFKLLFNKSISSLLGYLIKYHECLKINAVKKQRSS